MRCDDSYCDEAARIETSSFPAAVQITLLSWQCSRTKCVPSVCRFVPPTNSVYLQRRRKQPHSHCWLSKHGIAGRRICLLRPEQRGQRFWERFLMREWTAPCRAAGHVQPRAVVPLWSLLTIALLVSLLSCSAKPISNTVVMIIENSPTNLDPRVG